MSHVPLKFEARYYARLPMPLAEMYARVCNGGNVGEQHHQGFYFFESLIKLCAATLAAAYAEDLARGEPRNGALTAGLASLRKPMLGNWLRVLRELARHFGERADAAGHPLGHVGRQLRVPHRELPGVLALYRRIANRVDGRPAGDESCSLLDLFDRVGTYRNDVIGHGAQRQASFFAELTPLWFAAAGEVLAEEVFAPLGPPGAQLAFISSLRLVADDQVEAEVFELTGPIAVRREPLLLPRHDAAHLEPNTVAVIWPGRKRPVPIDPLLLCRGTALTTYDTLFLSIDRDERRAEYLSYRSGSLDFRQAAGGLKRLWELFEGRAVSEEEFGEAAGDVPAPTAAASATTRSTLVGDYEILAELGRGGMGIVYLARQMSLDRLVALKMLPAKQHADPVALARFQREMRALAQCDHPHIVKLLASGVFADGRPYYAMEYVPGADLEHVWKELTAVGGGSSATQLSSTTWVEAVRVAARRSGEEALQHTNPTQANAGSSNTTVVTPVSPAELSPPLRAWLTLLEAPALNTPEAHETYPRRVAEIMRQAALAVEAVHQQNILHRDIKPGNLMLTPDGERIMLMDFGLAKGVEASLTTVGPEGRPGTLRYMAPERLLARKITLGPQVDVWSLGITLWELLARRRLFADAENDAQLQTWLLTREVPLLRTVDPTLDRDLEAIVARATQREVGDRLPTARALAENLGLFLAGKPIPLRVPSARELAWRWMKKNPVVAGLAASLAVLLLVLAVAGPLAAIHFRKLASELETRRQESQSQLAKAFLKEGFTQLERSDAAGADLWWARALKTAGDDSPEIAAAARLHLGARQSERFELVAEMAHDDAIWDLAASPDGKLLASASHDGTIRLWDFATGAAVGEPLAQGDKVDRVVFHPHLPLLACVSYLVIPRPEFGQIRVGSARLWRTDTRQAVGRPLQHEGGGMINSLAFSLAGDLLATASDDGTAQLWDTATGHSHGPALVHPGPVKALAFSADGKQLATGGADGQDDATQATEEKLNVNGNDAGKVGRQRGAAVRLWDTSIGKEIATSEMFGSAITSLALAKDQEMFLAGTERGEIVALGADDLKQKYEAKFHRYIVRQITPLDDSGVFLTASADGAVAAFELESGKVIGPLMICDRTPMTLSASANREFISVGTSEDGSAFVGRLPQLLKETEPELIVRVSEWEKRGAVARLPHVNLGITSVVFHPQLRLLAVAGHDRTLRLWRLPETLAAETPVDLGEVYHAAFSADSRRLATRPITGSISLWEAATGKRLGELAGPESVNTLALNTDGTLLAIGGGGKEGGLELWDVKDPTQPALRQTLKPGASVNALSFSDDGRLLASAGHDDQVRLWNAAAGTPRGAPLEHKSLLSVAFDHQGKLVASGSGEILGDRGELRLWNIETGKLCCPPLVHQGAVASVAFSHDGKLVATGSWNHTARIWRVSDGAPLTPPIPHEDGVQFLKFNPSDQILVTGAGSRARMFAVATGQPLTPQLVHGEGAVGFAFDPEADPLRPMLWTVSFDNNLRRWRMPTPLTGKPEQIEKWLELVSGNELDEGGALRPLDAAAWQTRKQELDALGGPPVKDDGAGHWEVADDPNADKPAEK